MQEKPQDETTNHVGNQQPLPRKGLGGLGLDSERPRIILVGYMGSGKTTVGKALSADLGMPFYDLDWYIESRMHKTVKQIFDTRGEEGFREIERNMLHEVAEFENVIISCGGGTPCFFDNMDYINQQGESVYLKCSPEVLHRHLKMGKTVRPLLLNKTHEEVENFIREQLVVREPHYSKAKHTVDVTLMDNYDKIKITVAKLKEALHIA
ncbi:MAG: shikimate kinase [Prevotella sp.]|nr:shikimate kinase [Prevotella sp.]